MERNAQTAADATASLAALCTRAAPMRLVGSLLAVPPHRRAPMATALVAAGLGVHVDLIDDSYPLAAGVDPELLAQLEAGVADVHLMVSDPLRTAQELLPHRPARLTVQLEDLGEDPVPSLARCARACHDAGVALHVGIAPATPRERLAPLRDLVDGVLVMLCAPGAPGGRADLALLDGLPPGLGTLTVDGGARPELLDELAARGVARVVMGRALVAALP